MAEPVAPRVQSSAAFARRATWSLGAAIVTAVMAALGSPACLDRREEPKPDPDVARCTSCHGDPSRPGDYLRRAAPPIDVSGNKDPSYPGVGAHDIHLSASSTHAAIACDECHVVPATVNAPGHADDGPPGDVTFGSLARTGGLAPSFDPATQTCQKSYCHGASWAVWSLPRTSSEACGTCHGLPPPAPHPQSDRCSECHGAVIDADRHFIAPDRHVNGVVDYKGGECNACHGNEHNPAPPVDTLGNTDVTAIGVGAHQAHLAGGQSSRALACNECHVVPEHVEDPTHVDGLPAEVTFSGIAASGGRDPHWDEGSATCGGSYCHAPTPGDTRSSPVWNAGAPAACTSCHGLPPPAPHPQSTNCSACHGDVVGSDNRTIIAPDRHVDGVVDYSPGACKNCHGSSKNPAPPLDTSGNSEFSALGVGAHQVHLSGGSFSRPLGCDECHVVPKHLEDPTHADGLPAEVTFSGIADTDGREPRWNEAKATCQASYCHGPSPSDQRDSPKWNVEKQLACTSCHGLPPPLPHPQSETCSACHGGVVASDNRTIIEPSLHVNGEVNLDVTSSCTSCHGSVNTEAPPVDAEGNTETTAPGVGAHQTHVRGTERSRAVPCAECHVVPKSVLATGHVDSARPAELAFSGVALTNGAKPRYENGTCLDTSCHGAVSPEFYPMGGSHTTPSWTRVDGTEAACGSCHGLPPPPPHPQIVPGYPCHSCHGDLADDDLTFTHPELHVDGVVTFAVP